jgi:hypothetical protein
MKINSLILFLVLFKTSFTQDIPYNALPDWQSTSLGHYATGLALADINGDGFKDLVVANGNDMARQNLVVYYNDGNGTFPVTPSWSSSDIDYHGHLSVGDINKDGWLDVAVSVYIGQGGFSQPGKVKVYYNQGGELELAPSFQSAPMYNFSLALGDANGNGWLDIAVATSESYGSKWEYAKVFYNYQGYFNPQPDWQSSNLAGFMDVEFADMDKNGFLDLAFIGNHFPNAIYLADSLGVISPNPAWQSAETVTYNNSLDIGFIGNQRFPAILTTGNNQLGGDGKVRMYEFKYGVNQSGAASYLSPPYGFGSGIILFDVTGDGKLDLIYGGWWLPIKIIKGTAQTFETQVMYSSSTNSVVETIQLADLGRKSMEVSTDTLIPLANGTKCLRVDAQLVENWLSVIKNGEMLHDTAYCSVPGKSWLSFVDTLYVTDTLIITYEKSPNPDMVITNWDTGKGNYIFYNKNNYLNINELYVNNQIIVYPNPANNFVRIEARDNFFGSSTISITDIHGRKIFEQLIDNVSIEINTESYTSGMYFITISKESGQIINNKLFINR